MDEQELSAPGRYRSDLRNVVGSSAYGYTLTVWSTASVLTHAYGLPSPPEVFSFFLGAVAGFAGVGTLAFGGVAAEFGGESRRVRLWGSFRFVSVALAVGAAWFLSAHVPSMPGWPVGSFVATVCYYGVVGGERRGWRGRARNVRQNEGPWSRPYSPECVEGEFSEVQIQDRA